MPQDLQDTERQAIPLNPRDEHWKKIFDKYDRDKDGYINLRELRDIVDSREYEHDIPDYCIKKIHNMADKDSNGRIDLEEFVYMIHHPDLAPLFGHYVNRYVHMLVPRRIDPTQTVTDGQYEDEYSCYPPPFGMILISLIEVAFHITDEAAAPGSTLTASGPMAESLIYEPRRRYQAWRFLTYMFVHVGYFHLIVNLLVQIMLGTPLEMVHRWWRVLAIYFAGVVAGSLGTSITDPAVRLAGASGGVYALITAHIATIILNWHEMSYPYVQLLIFLVITGVDVSTAIYNRYYLDIEQHIGYTAHLCGALAGLLVGLNVLRNLEVKKYERFIWWGAIVIYASLMTTAILWNACYPDYFPKQVYSN